MNSFSVVIHSVHASGINWELVGVLLGPVLTVFGAFTRFIAKRIERNRNELRAHFTEVNQKFATMDAIGSRPVRDLTSKIEDVQTKLVRQDRRASELSERLARLEGPIRDAANGVESKPH